MTECYYCGKKMYCVGGVYICPECGAHFYPERSADDAKME